MDIAGLKVIQGINPPPGNGTNPPPPKRDRDTERETQDSIRAVLNKPAEEVKP